MKRTFILLFTVFSLLNGHSQTVNLDSGLVQYFPFDGDINDLSVNNMSTELEGELTAVTGYKGTPNTSYDFTNGAVLIPDTLELPVPFTISQWVYTSDDTWGQYESTGGFLSLSMTEISDDHIINTGFYAPECSLYVNFSDGVDQTNIDLRTESKVSYITSGKWGHVLYEFTKDSISIYVDGLLSGKDVQIKDNPDEIILPISDTRMSFNGRIDEFRIYDRLLSSEEKETLADPDGDVTGVKTGFIFDEQIVIYPNPSEGLFHLDINGVTEYDVSILNSLGEKLEDVEINSTDSSVDVSMTDYNNGVYFIQVTSSEGNVVKKIVLE